MKINKFKKNKTSKFRNTKLYKGLVVGACALTLTATLAGCGGKNLLDGTILEGAVVADVDGDIEILRETYFYDSDHKYVLENCDNHKHYINIATGEVIADSDGQCLRVRTYYSGNNNEFVNPRNVNVSNMKSISNYLTEEEYQKANKGELTDDDIIKIVTRIKSTSVEDETQKSR